MHQRMLVVALLLGLQHSVAEASEQPPIPFVDGRWSGGVEAGPSREGLAECWASTTFSDDTTLTLVKRSDGSWRLRLSNAGWRLPPSRRYAMVALVDFYPKLRIAAEAKSLTVMEIADIEPISLLTFIENGHTIDFTSNDFNAKYDLEGSAKAIMKVRSCRAD